MKKIVVPIDFSESSKNATVVAAQIVKATAAELVFVHWQNRVFSNPLISKKTNDSENNSKKEEYRITFNQRISELVKDNQLENTIVKVHLFFNKNVQKVFSTKEVNEGTDLIVMGTKGASNLKELFVGSNTQKVVRFADVPVLAIKDTFDISDITDLIFASDFNDESSVTAFRTLDDLIKAMNVKIHLLKVITPTYFEDTDTSEAKIQKFIERCKIENYKVGVYNNYSPEEGITEYAAQYENSIICMGTNGFKGFNHLLSGSISEDLVNRLNKPILTIKM